MEYQNHEGLGRDPVEGMATGQSLLGVEEKMAKDLWTSKKVTPTREKINQGRDLSPDPRDLQGLA
jgi:hypothetical protein